MNRQIGIIPILALLAAGLALAIPAAHADNAAVVINDNGCGLLNGNGGGAFTTASHAVITSSDNGLLTCKASVTPSSTGHAVRFDNANTGLVCGTPAGVTDDWHETVSADGQATLVCHVNPS